jgi:ATPase subunit of ABC transporter with duplicated ATPase domains
MKGAMTFIPPVEKRKLAVDGQALQVQKSLVIEDLVVNKPNGEHLFHIERLAFAPGDRVAIMGCNGAGKTTLLKVLMAAFQEKGQKGPIRFNPQVTIGYYDQELAKFKPGATLYSHLRDHLDCAGSTISKELITAGFPYAGHEQKVDSLSGGERARLQFLALKLANPSMFLLDEPTNHIDVNGIEELEEHLLSCPATTLFVSHDRRFIENVATRYLLIHEGHLREIADPNDYYAAVLARTDDEVVPTKTKPVALKVKEPRVDPDKTMLEIEALEGELQREPGRAGELQPKIDKLYRVLGWD